MAGVSLLFAGIFEIVWAWAMKASDGFTKPWAVVLMLATMGLSFALLAHAMAADPPRVIPVFAVRADLYGELGSLPGIAQMLERGHMLLGPPAPADLRDASEGPVRAAGLAIEPELTERILTDLGDARRLDRLPRVELGQVVVDLGHPDELLWCHAHGVRSEHDRLAGRLGVLVVLELQVAGIAVVYSGNLQLKDDQKPKSTGETIMLTPHTVVMTPQRVVGVAKVNY